MGTPPNASGSEANPKPPEREESIKGGLRKLWARSFLAVLKAELDEIQKRRGCKGKREHPWPKVNEPSERTVRCLIQKEKRAGGDFRESLSGPEAVTKTFDKAHEAKLFGLALSGGGIRSATFNLGVLQGLAERKLLRHVDYLSTVSGGGYIGSWLVAWIFHKARDPNRKEGESPVEAVEDALHPQLAQQPENARGPRKEPHPIRFLRDYSNYLTPRRGFFGADTWAAIAIYLRNVVLNLTILVLTLAALLILPRILVFAYYSSPNEPLVIPLAIPFWVVFVVTAFLLGLAVVTYLMNWPRRPHPRGVTNALRAVVMPAAAASLVTAAILIGSLSAHYHWAPAAEAPLVVAVLLLLIAIISIERSTSLFLHPWWERRRVIGSFILQKDPGDANKDKPHSTDSFDAYVSEKFSQKFGELRRGDWIEIWDIGVLGRDSATDEEEKKNIREKQITSPGGACVHEVSSRGDGTNIRGLKLRTEVTVEKGKRYFLLIPDRKTQRLSQRQILLTAVLPMFASAFFLTAWLRSIAWSEPRGLRAWAWHGLLIYSLIWLIALLWFFVGQIGVVVQRAWEIASLVSHAKAGEEQTEPSETANSADSARHGVKAAWSAALRYAARTKTSLRSLCEHFHFCSRLMQMCRFWTRFYSCLKRMFSQLCKQGRDEFQKCVHSGWRACGFWLWACAPLAGAVAGMLLFELRRLFGYWASGPASLWNSFSWGVPLVVGSFFLILALHIGLLGSCYEDHWREWWGRLSGFLLLGGLNWAALFALAIYSPLAVVWFRWWIPGVVSLGWIISTITGVRKGFSASTGKPSNNKLLHKALLLTPHVFVVGLMILLAFSLQAALVHTISGEGPALTNAVLYQFLHNGPSPQLSCVLLYPMLWASNGRIGPWSMPLGNHSAFVLSHWCLMNMTLNGKLFLAFVVCLAIAALLAWRVDVNEFSMQMLYRNRLVRCYLGASNLDRLPNFFTGFDPRDDLQLSWMTSRTGYDGPIPILNTSLNLVKGEELAWQERKAESFAYTPLYSGFDVWLEKRSRDYQQATRHLQRYGYRRTALFSYPRTCGPFLGTAMGISGAALSPNMGYHSNPSLAFLMTLFDVRLGWWVGNTRNPNTWYSAGPTFGLFWLMRELLGYTDDQSPYVYLSDGGHFENLGLYELVKRRCKYIIVCDAGEDPGLKFGDLGSAIRKVRDDFGIEIEIDATPISEKQRHFAVGTIHYEFTDGEQMPAKADSGAESSTDGEMEGWAKRQRELQGTIVVLKPSVLKYCPTGSTPADILSFREAEGAKGPWLHGGSEPADILSFQQEQSNFPNEPTADQWFNESQFESYRRLGQHIVCAMWDPIQTDTDPSRKERITSGLRSRNRPEIEAALAAMFESLRQKYAPESRC